MTRTVRWLDRFDRVTDAQWNRLLKGESNPFVQAAFLRNLESSGSIRAENGWTPHHLSVWHQEELVAMAPGYLKTNSHGEFVFDHAWAHAYAQYGVEYFPKQLFAVPYSPVCGPRWFAQDAGAESVLLQAMLDTQDQVSSVHVNFLPLQALNPLSDRGWIARHDVQYHWQRRASWVDFDSFLADMDHKHRKNIRRERRLALNAGIRYRTLTGAQIQTADIESMYGFYLQTFAEYGNYPALTGEFFDALMREQSQDLVLVLADDGTQDIAGALFMQSDQTLYGRYWGSTIQAPGLHFETCYYRGIDHCLATGLRRFEPGAQGAHKIDRGFLPTTVHSAHWIHDPAFRPAIQQWCQAANAGVRAQQDELVLASPFKRAIP